MNKKKIILLVLATLLGALSLWAYDKPAQGDGTSANPYQLTSPNDLRWFGYSLNKGLIPQTSCARLAADIEITADDPLKIGTAYSGTFDGDGHSLTLHKCRLFQTIGTGCVVKNLIFAPGGEIKSAPIANLISGNVKIINCHNYSAVYTGDGESVTGGLIANVSGDGSKVVFSRCSNHGTITANSGQCAGILGGKSFQAKVLFEYCCNTGSISVSNGAFSYSIAEAFQADTMRSCYNSAPTNVRMSSATLIDCFDVSVYNHDSTNDAWFVTAEDITSGAAAHLLNGGSAEGAWGQTLGTDPYPVFMKEDKSNAVYMVNYFYKYPHPAKYFNKGASYSFPDEIPAGMTIYDNKVKTTATSYTIAADHVFDIMSRGMSYDWTKKSLSISAPEDFPYLNEIIDTGLDSISVAMSADIDMAGTAYSYTQVAYRGTFDGGGHSIKNMNTVSPGGLFPMISAPCVIKNLTIAGGNAINGAIADKSEGKVQIIDCHNYANVSGDTYAGGLVGMSNSNGPFPGYASNVLNFRKCSNHGIISVNNPANIKSTVGGLLGGNNSGVLDFSSCYNVGEVKSSANSGAFCGISPVSDFFNCYNMNDLQQFYVKTDTTFKTKTHDYCFSVAKPLAIGIMQMPVSAFADGTVAYELNKNTSLIINPDMRVYWGQKIGTDSYPVFRNSDNSNQVYQVNYVYKKLYPNYSNFGATYTFPAVAPTGWDVYDNKVKTSVTSLTVNSDHFIIAIPHGMVDNLDSLNYKISTPEQLAYFGSIANNLNPQVNARITAPIDMTGITDYVPIGTEKDSFIGVFNGGKFPITNLKVTSDARFVGLFGVAGDPSIWTDSIKNIVLGSGCEFHAVKPTGVDTESFVGAIAGKSYYGTIENCSSSATVLQENDYKGSAAGGLSGFDYSSAILTNSCDGDITGVHRVGGIVGTTYDNSSYPTFMYYCYFNGTLNSTATSGEKHVGGLIGWSNERTNPYRCIYNSDKVVTPYFSMGKIFRVNKRYGTKEMENGDMAYNLRAEYAAAVWGQKIGTDNRPQPVTDENMVYKVAFVGDYNAEVYCNAGDQVTTPVVDGFNITYIKKGAPWTGETVNADITVNTKAVPTSCAFYNSADSTYSITTPANFEWVRAAIAKNVSGLKLSLKNDIDFSSVSNFVPLGDTEHPFCGKIFGNDFSLKNLRISSSSREVGFLGYGGANALVSHLTIDANSSVTGSGTAAQVGGFAGIANGLGIEHCVMDGKVTEERGAACGGFIGVVLNGELENSRLNGDVIGTNEVGGFFGISSTLSKGSFINGTVTSHPTMDSPLVGAYYGFCGYSTNNFYTACAVNGNKCKLPQGYVLDPYVLKTVPADVYDTQALADGTATFALNWKIDSYLKHDIVWGQNIGVDSLPRFKSNTSEDNIYKATLFTPENTAGKQVYFSNPIALNTAKNEFVMIKRSSIDEAEVAALPSNYYIIDSDNHKNANNIEFSDEYALPFDYAYLSVKNKIVMHYHPKRFSSGYHGFNTLSIPFTGVLKYGGATLKGIGNNRDYYLQESWNYGLSETTSISQVRISDAVSDSIQYDIPYFLAIDEKYKDGLTIEGNNKTLSMVTGSKTFGVLWTAYRGYTVGDPGSFVIDETGNYMVKSADGDSISTYSFFLKNHSGYPPEDIIALVIDANGIPTGIGEASLATPSVRVIGGIGKITVEGTARDIAVYTISGAMVSRDRATISCAPGIYIVKVDGKSYKTIVR